MSPTVRAGLVAGGVTLSGAAVLTLAFFLSSSRFGPWPECAEAASFLRRNVDDPSYLEIVSWEKRFQATTHDAKTGRDIHGVYLTVLYRTRNTYGAKVLCRAQITVLDGKPVQLIRLD